MFKTIQKLSQIQQFLITLAKIKLQTFLHPKYGRSELYLNSKMLQLEKSVQNIQTI